MSSEFNQTQNNANWNQPQEFLVSHQEFKVLQKFLPEGFSFAVSNKNTRMQQRKPVATEETLSPAINKQEKPPKRKAYAEAEQTIRGTSEGFKKCSKIHSALKRNANAGPFIEPVDPIALGIPTYFDVIKNPMDLLTVETKLKNHDYDSPEQFEHDVRLIWNNALTFNPPGSQVYRMAESMSIHFEDMLKRDEDNLGSYKPQPDRIKKKLGDGEESQTNRVPKGPTSKNMMEKPLTYQEKKQLSSLIRMLPTEHLWGVWNIVSGGDGNRNNEELEFDIETLPVRTARELEKYVRSKISTLQKKKKPNGNATSEPVVEKQLTAFKEDTKSSDIKPVANTESLERPAPVANTNGHETNNRSVQPNFRVDATAKNKLSSESSFISDLEDSDD